MSHAPNSARCYSGGPGGISARAFRTKYSGDLDAIGKILGTDFSKIAPNLPVGYSIFHLADVGDPFVMVWRPTCSNI